MESLSKVLAALSSSGSLLPCFEPVPCFFLIFPSALVVFSDEDIGPIVAATEHDIEQLCTSAQQHEQAKILHLVHQVFSKAAKGFFEPAGSESTPPGPAAPAALCRFCLLWIKVSTGSFGGKRLLWGSLMRLWHR